MLDPTVYVQYGARTLLFSNLARLCISIQLYQIRPALWLSDKNSSRFVPYDITVLYDLTILLQI